MSEDLRARGMLTLVCTNRGQHPRNLVGKVDYRRCSPPAGTIFPRWDPPVVTRPVKGSALHPADKSAHPYRFGCRRCGRDTRFSDATWEKLAAGMVAAGLSVVDISQLPG